MGAAQALRSPEGADLTLNAAEQCRLLGTPTTRATAGHRGRA